MGTKHVKFWKLTGSAIEEKKGVFAKVGSIQTMLCVEFDTNGNAVVGAASGEIYIFTGNNLTKTVKAHEVCHKQCHYFFYINFSLKGPVYSINNTAHGEFWSGGKDSNVKCWNSDFSSSKKSIVIPSHPSRKVATVKSVAEFNGKVIIGTATSEIYESVNGGTANLILQVRDILIDFIMSSHKGHGDGELWGLGTHGGKSLFATGSDDKTVRIWDTSKRCTVAAWQVGIEVRSVDFSPNGKLLAAGCANGTVRIKLSIFLDSQNIL